MDKQNNETSSDTLEIQVLLQHKTIEQPKESQSRPCFTASYSTQNDLNKVIYFHCVLFV